MVWEVEIHKSTHSHHQQEVPQSPGKIHNYILQLQCWSGIKKKFSKLMQPENIFKTSTTQSAPVRGGQESTEALFLADFRTFPLFINT